MKKHLSLVSLLATATLSHALQFEFVNNMVGEGYTNDDVYLMWATSATTTGDFNVKNGDGSTIALTNFGGLQSAGVALGSNDNATNGMTVNSVNSGTLYIGLSKTGNPFAGLNAAPSIASSTFPFMQVEITSMGNNADSGDITGINYFSFPVSVNTYSATNAPLQNAGFGTHTTQQVYSALANTYNTSTGYNPVITNAGTTIAVVGPSNYNVYSPSGGGSAFTTGPYQTYQNYLAKVYADQNASPNPTTTKLSYAGNGGYTADLTVTSDGNGHYGLQVSNVRTGPDITNPNSQTPIAGTITINPDVDGNSPTSVAIYSGVWYPEMGAITGDLEASGLVPTLLASVSASFETGAVGSFTAFPGSAAQPPENQFRFQQSNLWFTQPSGTQGGLYFDQLQSGVYYDPFLQVIADMTNYSVYGSPYADRYANWTVAINSTIYGLPSQPVSEWTPVDKWVITIGSTSVPEPSTLVLLGIAGAAAAFAGFRRARNRA